MVSTRSHTPLSTGDVNHQEARLTGRLPAQLLSVTPETVIHLGLNHMAAVARGCQAGELVTCKDRACLDRWPRSWWRSVTGFQLWYQSVCEYCDLTVQHDGIGIQPRGTGPTRTEPDNQSIVTPTRGPLAASGSPDAVLLDCLPGRRGQQSAAFRASSAGLCHCTARTRWPRSYGNSSRGPVNRPRALASTQCGHPL